MDSFKAKTQGKRGKRIQQHVKPDLKIPGNWEAFLRVDEIKEELFHFLADQLVSVEAVHEKVTSPKGDSVVCNVQDIYHSLL